MDRVAVGKRIDINLDRTIEITIQEHGTVPGNDNGFGDVAFKLRHVANDLHRPATQNVGRPDHQRKANFRGGRDSLRIGGRDGVSRLLEIKVAHQ